jgi:hypothetical protein
VVLSRNAKWLVVLMSLVTATTVVAAPTVGDCEAKLIAPVVPQASSTDNPFADEPSLFKSSRDSALADIAAELLKPPADFTSFSALPPGTRPLPAVPAALFMCLTGFVCVSLVRDRKVWLAAITFLLWAGQTGIAALPQAASHLVSRKLLGQYSHKQIYGSALVGRASRLRCDLEGTEYIGLLHHLEGIPTKIRNTKYEILPSSPSLCSGVNSAKGRNTNQSPNFAIAILSSYVIPANICLTRKVRQSVSFSPAFIFESMPRGPPNPAKVRFSNFFSKCIRENTFKLGVRIWLFARKQSKGETR